MLNKIALSNILFLDIETVPEVQYFEQLSEEKQDLWAAKSAYQRKEEITAKDFYPKAGIWAEFGKIICISVGYFISNENSRAFRVTSFYGSEPSLLKEFKQLLDTHFNKPQHLLCAHNGKEFDFPYLARRMVINSIALPTKLNLFGKKPWEVPHLDTLELWKFGDLKTYTSLKLLTQVLNIPSPKYEIDGSAVYRVYYEEKDIDKIITYCEKDTIAVAQVVLKFRNEQLLDKSEIKIV